MSLPEEEERDVAAVLHLMSAGRGFNAALSLAERSFGWGPSRRRAVAARAAQHQVVISGKLKESGKELMSRYPTAVADLTNAAEDGPRSGRRLDELMADLATRRRILEALVDTSEKYRRPFESGEFAAFSIIGTRDWQDYATTVLQIVEIETMLNIETKLDQMLQLLEAQAETTTSDGLDTR